jgi:hypothetical protein
MKRKIIMTALALIALIVIFSVSNENATPASAAPRTTGYTIDWYTVDSGGAMNSVGGSYSLSGTIGQPDAGTQSNTPYTLNGGFWGFLDSLSKLFLPLIVR